VGETVKGASEEVSNTTTSQKNNVDEKVNTREVLPMQEAPTKRILLEIP
jgi:hypothetical protein